MLNCNFNKYNATVNFGFVGTGLDIVHGFVKRPLLGKVAAISGGLGSLALGYGAIKADQAKNNQVFDRALNAKTPEEREFLKSQYNQNNNAFYSDTLRNGGFALGGLLGAGAIVAPTVAYNAIKGNPLHKYLMH